MPRVIWFCDLCGEQFDNEKQANGCEARHICPSKFTSRQYSGGDPYSTYPIEMEIEMADGKLVTYRRFMTEWDD